MQWWSDWGIFTISVPNGFLCSPEHRKVYFELLKMFRATQNALPLQGAGFSPKSKILSNLGCHFYSFEWEELFFFHTIADSVSLYLCFG